MRDVSFVDVVEQRGDEGDVGGGDVGADESAVAEGACRPVGRRGGSLAVVLDGEDLAVSVGVSGSGCRSGGAAEHRNVADHVEAVDLDVQGLAGGAVVHLGLAGDGAVARRGGVKGERPQRRDTGVARELEVARPRRRVRDWRVGSRAGRRHHYSDDGTKQVRPSTVDVHRRCLLRVGRRSVRSGSQSTVRSSVDAVVTAFPDSDEDQGCPGGLCRQLARRSVRWLPPL